MLYSMFTHGFSSFSHHFPLIFLVYHGISWYIPYFQPLFFSERQMFCEAPVLLFSLAFAANIGLNNFSLSLVAISHLGRFGSHTLDRG